MILAVAGARTVRNFVALGLTTTGVAAVTAVRLLYSAGISEEITGRLLGRVFGHRDDYVLATKVYFATGNGRNDGGLSRKRIMPAIDASLRRLGTDYVDLYQVHRWDYQTLIEETMAASRSRTSRTPCSATPNDLVTHCTRRTTLL